MLIQISELNQALEGFDLLDWSFFIDLKDDQYLESVEPYAINVENGQLVLIIHCEVGSWKTLTTNMYLFSIPVRKIKDYIRR